MRSECEVNAKCGRSEGEARSLEYVSVVRCATKIPSVVVMKCKRVSNAPRMRSQLAAAVLNLFAATLCTF